MHSGRVSQWLDERAIVRAVFDVRRVSPLPLSSIVAGFALALVACGSDDANVGESSTAAATESGSSSGNMTGSTTTESGSTTTATTTSASTDNTTTVTSSSTGVSSAESSSDGSSTSTGNDDGMLIEQRPYALLVPDDYDPEVAATLVLSLHGYGATGELQALYFGLTEDAQTRGYPVAMRDGLIDGNERRFWDATDACCNSTGEPIDDVAYLNAVLNDVVAQYKIDPARIYVIGHSNGGFMAHRLACEIGDRIAAILSLAGANWENAEDCPAENAVNILQVHGTADGTISYDGGNVGGANYPSAAQTVAHWAAANGCEGDLEDVDTIDLLPGVTGEETTRAGYTGCPDGGDVLLWTLQDGEHIPTFGDAWIDEVWTYFDAHPKP